jgi:hypothetical protein
MSPNIASKDNELIYFLMKYRLLTVDQIALLSQRSNQVIRRRLRYLIEQGIVSSSKRIYGNRPGRPEDIIFLTNEGRRLFQAQNGIAPTEITENQKTVDQGSIDHQLFLNWTLIHLTQLENAISGLSVKWLTLNASNFHPEQQGLITIREKIMIETDPKKTIEFIPDCVFSVTNLGLQKSLLFFLEVDMGTESIVSPNKEPNGIHQKIINYQTLFQSERYKRYEKAFNAKFKGFRLLFITNTESRHINICRLVREMRPSDFIWVTHQEKMFQQGLGDKIWARGGKNDEAPQSILGDKMAFQMAIMQV